MFSGKWNPKRFMFALFDPLKIGGNFIDRMAWFLGLGKYKSTLPEEWFDDEGSLVPNSFKKI